MIEQSQRILVSVITAVYNGVEYIAACMNSVANAFTDNFIAIEHVLIDDGSNDNSATEICATAEDLSGSNYRVKFLQISHSGKPALVRNRGIECATGKYVFCLDHDDVLLQNALITLVRHLEATTSHFAYGDFIRVGASLEYIPGYDYRGRSFAELSVALKSLFLGDHFFQHSFMLSKHLWSLVGGYDEGITFGEDFDICVRFMLAGHLPQYIPITTHMHRNHERGLTACYNLDRTICRVWLAEHQAHYAKHETSLRLHLSTEAIQEIRQALRIGSETCIHSPPTREEALVLARLSP